MERTVCNFCGSEDSITLLSLPDYMLERRTPRATFVRCRRCGLVYQNPRPDPEEMQAHYPPEYDLYYKVPSAESTPWLLRQAYRYGMRKRIRPIIRRMHGGRLLDVGCSTGTFLLEMQRERGWTVEGLEVSPYAAQIARDHGLQVTTGTLAEAGYPADSFDAVTLWDVLEHLHDPKAGLAEIRRILKPGGILVLRIPNLDSWDARIFGKYWVGLDAPRHLYVFGDQNIRDMLESVGLKILDMQSNIGNYPTTVLSVRFLLSAHGKRESYGWLVKVLNSAPARLLSAPFFWLFSLGLRGAQLTVVAGKGAA